MLYKTKTVLDLTGFKRDKFNQWLAKRIIVPEKLPKRSGDRSGFSADNLVHFLLVEKLCDCGINLIDCGHIARGITSDIEDEESNIWKEYEKIKTTEEGDVQFYVIINVEEHLDFEVSLYVERYLFPASIVVEVSQYFNQVNKYLYKKRQEKVRE